MIRDDIKAAQVAAMKAGDKARLGTIRLMLAKIKDRDIELRTVDVHIRRLRKAINLPGTADIIRTVRSAGYALDAGKSV